MINKINAHQELILQASEDALTYENTLLTVQEKLNSLIITLNTLPPSLMYSTLLTLIDKMTESCEECLFSVVSFNERVHH